MPFQANQPKNLIPAVQTNQMMIELFVLHISCFLKPVALKPNIPFGYICPKLEAHPFLWTFCFGIHFVLEYNWEISYYPFRKLGYIANFKCKLRFLTCKCLSNIRTYCVIALLQETVRPPVTTIRTTGYNNRPPRSKCSDGNH